MSTQALRRVIHPEVRILSEKDFICQYVASDETLDSYNEIVSASGWKFDQFKKNAPFVDSHDYSSIEKQVGKVIDFGVENKQLIETVQWAAGVEGNSLAKLGWQMTVGKFLKAVSVGFYPTKMVTRWDSDPAPFKSECLARSADADKVRVIYTEQQQIELSTCIIGANPNAVALAIKSGCVTSDLVMNVFQNPTDKNGSSADAPGRADESTKRRARMKFLGRLQWELKNL